MSQWWFGDFDLWGENSAANCARRLGRQNVDHMLEKNNLDDIIAQQINLLRDLRRELRNVRGDRAMLKVRLQHINDLTHKESRHRRD